MSEAQRKLSAYWRATGTTQAVAAQHVGVNEDTIGRWERQGDPVYWEAYEEAVQRVLTEVYSEALAVMREELQSDDSLERWRAANSLLNHMARLSVRRSEVTHRDAWSMEAILLNSAAEDGGVAAVGDGDEPDERDDQQYSPRSLLRAISQ